MITATVANSQLFLSAIGNDIDTINELPSVLKLIKSGPSINPKTGRKQVVFKFEEYDVDSTSIDILNSDINTLKSQLASEKKKNTKLQSEIRTLKNAIKIDSIEDAPVIEDDN